MRPYIERKLPSLATSYVPSTVLGAISFNPNYGEGLYSASILGMNFLSRTQWNADILILNYWYPGFVYKIPFIIVRLEKRYSLGCVFTVLEFSLILHNCKLLYKVPALPAPTSWTRITLHSQTCRRAIQTHRQVVKDGREWRTGLLPLTHLWPVNCQHDPTPPPHDALWFCPV